MTASDYVRRLRERVGTDLLQLPSVTAAIFDAQGRVLLLRHHEGDLWVLPGGAVEPNERPADALVRETFEETGLHVAPVRLVGVYGGPEHELTYGNGDTVSYLMTACEARIVGGELEPDGHEAREARWVHQADAAALPQPRWAEAVLPDVFAGDRSARFDPPTWRP